MDTFGKNDLRRLTGEQQGPCVSIYLPTHVAGEQGQQDAIRLKNLLQQVEMELCRGWLRAPDAREMLDAAHELPLKPQFWSKRSHGLAIFMTPLAMYRYRLPIEFEELTAIDHRFHILPVLPMITEGERFLLLTLSQQETQLFGVTRHEITPIDVPDMPINMKEALNYSATAHGSQFHSAARGDGGKQAAVFHGQGGQNDAHKSDLAQYFRMIDKALQPVLRDENALMLLAGVEYLLPIFRDVCTYSRIVPQELHGNWDRTSHHELHRRACNVMSATIDRARTEAESKFRRLTGSRLATSDLREIVTAAHAGRIETLFADIHAHPAGVFDPHSAQTKVHVSRWEGDEDLLDTAAAQTLLHCGTVYSVAREQVPSGKVAAAVLRY